MLSRVKTLTKIKIVSSEKAPPGDDVDDKDEEVQRHRGKTEAGKEKETPAVILTDI